MTWETAASGNVRRALALELTMLLDAGIADWQRRMAHERLTAPSVLDSRKGLNRTRGTGEPYR